jgi:hypothetical protein
MGYRKFDHSKKYNIFLVHCEGSVELILEKNYELKNLQLIRASCREIIEFAEEEKYDLIEECPDIKRFELLYIDELDEETEEK